ncbi:MAG TPA: hypothetical protein DIC42_06820 [Holosporales bacterium]|nr:hypothetical protein [Holosporales bacterium]
METKILDVIANKEKIMASQNIVCPSCGEKQFSPFDKLFTSSYGQCYMCEPEDEIKSDNIFAII